MGTTYRVVVVPGQLSTAGLDAEIAALLAALDGAMSTYKPDSELNRLNRQMVGQPFVVSPDLLAVLLLSAEAFEITQGAFDPTVGPLVDLWGFGPLDTADQMPDAAAIRALRSQMGFQRLVIDARTSSVVKRAALRLDLSGVVPGYAADRVAQLLEARGLRNYLVDMGGELRLAGRNGAGRAWRIGVELPQLAPGGVERALVLSDRGVATSGDYRNYFERNGKRYSHIISPLSGRPIANGVVSVTVIAATAGLADALSTGLMVLGRDPALELAAREGIAVYLMVRDDDRLAEFSSPAFAPYLDTAVR